MACFIKMNFLYEILESVSDCTAVLNANITLKIEELFNGIRIYNCQKYFKSGH